MMAHSHRAQLQAPNDFVLRLMQVCGTTGIADTARAIGVSYQTFKNYMPPINRLPAPIVLLRIAQRTNTSIHWLLTGKGPKTGSLEDIFGDHEVFELELPTTRLLLRVVSVESSAPPRTNDPVVQSGQRVGELAFERSARVSQSLPHGLVNEESPTTKKGKRLKA
jgi:hypothetical protein